MQSWNTISQKINEIDHENQFSTRIKGNNIVLIWRNLPNLQSQITPPQYQLLYKVWKKISQEMLKMESGNDVVTDGRTDGMTLIANFWTDGKTKYTTLSKRRGIKISIKATPHWKLLKDLNYFMVPTSPIILMGSRHRDVWFAWKIHNLPMSHLLVHINQDIKEETKQREVIISWPEDIDVLRIKCSDNCFCT